MSTGLPREWMRGPQWASPDARATWEPVVTAAAGVWGELELVSVSAGLRPSALVHLTPGELVRATRDCAAQGLVVTPLADGGPQLRCAVHREGHRDTWLRAWAGADDVTMGALLGFPPCCIAHFMRTWQQERRTDTVLYQASYDGPAPGNIMLRHLGVRLVPHLPCSADCAGTLALGQAMLDMGRSAGLDTEPLLALLALPATYSALHGVALTETPHFKFWCGTDYTETERRAVRKGSTPVGLGAPWTWEDNGFSSQEAMDTAHKVVMQAVGPCASALDLGAGDGTLLARIAAGRTAGAWHGIEIDAARAARGRERWGNVQLTTGSIAEWVATQPQAVYDVALVMPGRLIEMPQVDAAATRAVLARQRRVVVYAYGDWLDKYDGLAGLVRAAQLPGILVEVEGVGGQVAAAELVGRD